MAKRSSRPQGTRTERNSRRHQKASSLGQYRNQPLRDHEPEETAPREMAPFKPMTQRQGLYEKSLIENILTFGVGPAGTGKTYVAVSVGCCGFINGLYDRMIFTRPALGSDEDLGFFPGDQGEKFAPWMVPVKDVLDKHLGKTHVEYLIKREKIVFQPFATMRGLSWDKTFIGLDEAQNTTPKQMELFLTRVGKESTVFVDGDYRRQKDVAGKSGLEDAIHRLQHKPGVGVVEFTVDDIVRSGFARLVVEAYAE